MKRYAEVAAAAGRRYLHLLLFALIIALALSIRLVDLGTTPSNLTADELDDLQNAYRVLEGRAGGFFALDWNQAPNFNMYLKAGFLELFGFGIAASRMYSVVLSLATLVVFYALARRWLTPLPSLLALFLLATSLWFLHFSRTPWVAMSATLAAVLTAYVLDLAIERGRLWLFALLGAAVALAAYGYFAGRALVLVVIACYGLALLLRGRRDPWVLTRGFVFSGVVALSLFAPQLETLLENWHYSNTRPRAVSIFRVEGEYLGDSSKPEIIVHQTLRTVRGFLLLDKSVSQYGLWARHRPVGWAFLDQATGVLYWIGLASALLRWRRFAYWWAFLLIPLFFTQVFSVGTPDGSRALMVAPFMFLFVALGIETLLGLARGALWRRALPVATVFVVVLIGAFNVDRYFDWMKEPGAVTARKPAIANDEFVYWRELARAYASEGRLVSEADWLRYRESELAPDKPP